MNDPEKAAEPAKAVDPESTSDNVQKHHSSSSSSVSALKQGGDDIRQLDSKIVDPKKGVDAKEDLDAALAHLPDHEQKIIREQLEVPDAQVSYFTLFRYSTNVDTAIFLLSTAAAIIAGAALPLMTIVFGSLTGSFQKIFLGIIDFDEFNRQLTRYSLYFVYFGIAQFVLLYFAAVGFIYAGEHVTQKIRANYFRAILRQNIGFFDKLGAGEITTRITADTNLIQEGISEKVALILTSLATFFTAFIVAMVRFWKLTLILSSTIVAMMLVMGISAPFLMKYGKMNLLTYSQGNTIAEEAIASIRNATAFGTQRKLAEKYDKHLRISQYWGRNRQIGVGIMVGMMFCVLFLNSGLGFWMGARFLVRHEVGISAIITILLAVVIGSTSLGNVAPNIPSISTAIAAGGKIFSTIERASPIDPESEDGTIPDSFKGDIEFRHIKHIYPSRPEVVVMEDINLSVPSGKTTALVGPSGSGKSTVVGLLERFYNPVGGSVLLDGHDIKTLNLRWLRQQISLVSQEPTLFGVSIFENIRMGLIGSPFENESEDKIKHRIEDAAKMANAHDFITGLPDRYETNVGQQGFLLSGGQKQRIAIARAIVSDPKILLLDEATSALDTKSEGVVQSALDKAAEGRTTISIAHRLSTIKTADNIVVLAAGRIVEQGTHDDLIDRNGVYRQLVTAQRLNDEKKATVDDEGDEGFVAVEKEISRQMSQKSKPREDLEANYDDDLKRTETTKSVSSDILAKREKEKDAHYSLSTLIRFIFRLNKAEKLLMIVGLGVAIIAGGGQPVQSIFYSKSVSNLSLPETMYGKLMHDASFWSLMFLMMAFVQLLAQSGQGIIFAICSESLIFRARSQAFRALLRQDIAFFDLDENSAGALTSFLATETKHVAGISGVTLASILNSLTTLVACLTVALAIGWKLALVCISTVPVLLACGFFRFLILARFQNRAKVAYQSSASFACESTSAIHTVASLTRERQSLEIYEKQLATQLKKSLVSISKSSILYAASQSFVLFCLALAFWYGGTLLAKSEYTMFQFFVCLTEVIFGSQSAGVFFSFAPDMSLAKSAAADLKKLFDRVPPIDNASKDGETLGDVEGTVEFRDVHFRYPTRPEQPVLRGLNLSVKPGQYVALVGPSGCGKSTTIALIERFYDTLAGGVYVDGKDITRLNLASYRSYLALVSQEPTLYQGTIRENILLGIDDDDVPDEIVIDACKAANIYDFIVSLPDGFSTLVGSKGAMLSGGQKQRIAIARALIRDPKILLLDEATSALDSESEKIVQAALDAAAKGRTTIAVAHRLSSIQNADVIYVFDQGRIVESGTHHELLANKGRYYELVHLQSLEKTH